MTFHIRDSVFLVTGANRGIGKVILETALQRGAKKVYAAVRDVQTADDLVETHGDQVIPVRLDLNDPSSVREAALVAKDVNVVVNNAGVLQVCSAFADETIETLQYEMEANVYGLIRVAQAFAPVLKANGGGVFVQLNSVASLNATPEFATYCASKAAAYSITLGLRKSLQEQGTLVVSAHPGPIQTDMGRSAGFGEFASDPAIVAPAIFDAIEQGHFHAWIGPLAELISEPYQPFVEQILSGDMKQLREQAFGL
ncbi:SDR family oxidoreductase [Rhodopirellula sp. JC740]|uniref:SDR family oxidoreductase n=1 Tax=Rhodopirellula halodulae TaxID=2894198 RepID=A0ABS8NPB8_9BACT|nr:SDR family oxidoreductase [Rhodopirellula sp. JC740]MCC9645351.1 SDR family oxidoreductase [Rhodopirellula sp. JC740]